MIEQHTRSIMLYGKENIEKLKDKSVCVFGVGGVGGYVVEGLCRIGIGRLIIVDHDIISVSNLNRQIIATHSTIGLSKVEVMKQRCLDINPNLKIETYQEFYLPNHHQDYLFHGVDYVVDAIDTVSAKIGIIEKCQELNIPIISSMGTGNKLDPSQLEVSDIYKTSIDPLARVMRRELKKRHIKKCKVVYSKEAPLTPTILEKNENGKVSPGSSPFVPSSAGLLIASEVIKDLLQ
ncbi:MAG: ThiF family adenylyltransferase [Beduini sp.]